MVGRTQISLSLEQKQKLKGPPSRAICILFNCSAPAKVLNSETNKKQNSIHPMSSAPRDGLICSSKKPSTLRATGNKNKQPNSFGVAAPNIFGTFNCDVLRMYFGKFASKFMQSLCCCCWAFCPRVACEIN